MKKNTQPKPDALLDAFGTRIEPDEIIQALARAGVDSFSLRIEDSGLTLRLKTPKHSTPIAQAALTCLKSLFSPLMPIRMDGTALENQNRKEIVDARERIFQSIRLRELGTAEGDIRTNLDSFFAQLPACRNITSTSLAVVPEGLPQTSMPLFSMVQQALNQYGDPAKNGQASISLLATTRERIRAFSPTPNDEAVLHLLCWQRQASGLGLSKSAFIAASNSPDAIEWLAATLCGETPPLPRGTDIFLDGLVWGVARRPIVAAEPDESRTIARLDAVCTRCGVCAQMCPTGYLSNEGLPATDDTDACIRCYACVEACPRDALRPTYASDTATLAHTLSHRPGWLARLSGAPGPMSPAPFTPSYLLPKEAANKKADSPTVLGIAAMTMQEHAAVLIKDGEIVGAIEEERLLRLRHYGWTPPGRPGVTPAVDPTLTSEQAFCRNAIRVLLEAGGLTLDDVDVIAINGLHSRFRRAYSLLDDCHTLPTIHSGRSAYFSHHLCHAASAFRLSGVSDTWVFTVDGRGDRETAVLYRGRYNQLTRAWEILSLYDRSIGGVYETITRQCGFGSHGQGSLMALAAFDTPSNDFSGILSASSPDNFEIHEQEAESRFADSIRAPDAPLTVTQRKLAASAQKALETSVLALLENGGVATGEPLAMAGGVALNCRLNQVIREQLEPQTQFVQPAANDAGTALGAALEALAQDIPGVTFPPMTHCLLGPAFDNQTIEASVQRAGLVYEKTDDIAQACAEHLAKGNVVAWFQGRMEFGPRALGARSLLADPRTIEMKERVNRMKSRESWRPFGPSVLAEKAQDWFEDCHDSRFMLFTMNIKKERQELIPALMHVDGSTRPQMVHAETHPRYHAMICAFERISGIPMVLNTSFNRRGEPIVCTPQDALDCFVGLGADVLAMGDFLVYPRQVAPNATPEFPDIAALKRAPRGRRLGLRLTTTCDCNCVHCTLRDMPESAPPRSYSEAIRAIAEGRVNGCDELVILRGEPVLWPKLADLFRLAKEMGYRHIQIQSNGRALADAERMESLLNAGLDAAELMLFAADEALHDRLAGAHGAFRQTLIAIRRFVSAGRFVMVSIPTLRENLASFEKTLVLLSKLGVRHVQFNFPRPVEKNGQLLADALTSLSEASAAIRRAIAFAEKLPLTITTEGLPLCHLPPSMHDVPDAGEDWRRHRTDDLHLLHESLDDERKRARPAPPVCRTCRLSKACPKTWALYQEVCGSGEFTPFS